MIPSLLRDQHRLFLLSRLLMAPRQERSTAEQALDKLQEIINEKFKPLANLDNLPNEIEIYDDMLRGKEEVADLCRFPLLAGRHVVAIGGAFSSGKSSFVNSFLGKDILPTAIERTTALPTYIVTAPAEVISAVTIAGRMQQLRKMDFEFLTHNSAQDHNINLNTFLRYLTLSSPDMPFENIAFLDTPGYSADPQYGLAVSDQMVAELHLRTADAIIWCVDTENGGFRQSDIDFLQGLGNNRPLFVVFNKADLKDPTELPGIKEQAEKTLLNSGLQVSGLTMYSSHHSEDYPAEELTAFLQEISLKKKSPSWHRLIGNTLQCYVKFHSAERDNLNQQIRLFNHLTVILEAAAGQSSSTAKGNPRKKTLADYDGKKPTKAGQKQAKSDFWMQADPVADGMAGSWESPGFSQDMDNFEIEANSPELLPTMQELLKEMKNRYASHQKFADKFADLGREIDAHLDTIRDALDAEITKGWQHLQIDSHRQLLMELINDQVAKTCATIEEKLESFISQFSLPTQNGTDTREITTEVEVLVPLSWFQKLFPGYFTRQVTSVTKTVTVTFDTPYTYTKSTEIGAAFKLWYARLHKETGRELVEASQLSTDMLPEGVTPELVANVTKMAEKIIREIFAQYNDDHVKSWKKLLTGIGTIKNDGLPIIMEAMRRQMTNDLEMLGNIPMHFANLLGKKLGD